MDVCAGRPVPIPCFTEMSSWNRYLCCLGALRKGANQLAQNLFGSFTLGAGQFCTKPGIVLFPQGAEAKPFVDQVKVLVEERGRARS